MPPTNTSKLLPSVISRWQQGAKISSIEALTPDASLRRYFRIRFNGAAFENGPDSVVCMVFDSVKCPEYDVGASVPSDEAYVELSKFFDQHGVCVPELYFDARDEAVLIIEDVGSRHLIDVFDERQSAKRDAESIKELYQEAIRQISIFQNIPEDKSFFPFKRSFTEGPYYMEMLEFCDYLLKPLGVSDSLIREVEVLLQSIATELSSFPRVLAHRDFHSWNLLVDYSGNIRVIDFQDALMATTAYDVVGLLHDRDTDRMLGSRLYNFLLTYAQSMLSKEGDFLSVFHRTSLQRDLKVSGRFRKLSLERGLVRYDVWVPGTLRRLRRTLAHLAKDDSDAHSRRAYAELYKLLSGTSVFEGLD